MVDKKHIDNYISQALELTVSNPVEAVVMCFDDGAYKTDDIEECGNEGCGFNSNGNCTASGTECFGYIDPECHKDT